MDEDRKAAKIGAVTAALRELVAATAQADGAMARSLRIAPSDLACLSLLRLEGQATAGRLSAATGLTTGAITALLDRLEKAGFVRRERDGIDRRKVTIRLLPARARALEAAETRRRAALEAELADLDATEIDGALAVLLRALRQARAEADDAVASAASAPGRKSAASGIRTPGRSGGRTGRI